MKRNRNCLIFAVVAAGLGALLPTGSGPAIAETQNCQTTPITEAQLATKIAADLAAATPERAKDIRYLTLANLVNACATAKQLQIYRHAVVKLLNSLSWMPQPVRLRTIDPDGAVIRLHLSDLGWTKDQWNRLLLTYPYGLNSNSEQLKAITNMTGTALPYLRADWFTHTVARPPLYYSLLKLPRNLKALKDKIGSEAAANVRSYWARRSGYQVSKVGGRIRLTPKISYSDKPFKTDGDAANNEAQRKTSNFPSSVNVKTVPKLFASVSHFTLPNGFRGYFLHTGRGGRLDWGYLLPCLICNFAGISMQPDLARDGVARKPHAVGDVTLMVSGLYPASKDKQALHLKDQQKWNAALAAAGLDPALERDTGVEPIRALSDKFAKARLTIATAAAELGMAADVFEQKLLNANKKAFHTARVLAQQTMSRKQFERKFTAITEVATDLTPLRNKAVGWSARQTSAFATTRWYRRRTSAGFALSLVSDKSAYRRGETVQLSVQPEIACNLTLIGVSANGSGTVIYPNRFRQDTYVPTGKILTIPDQSAPFKLRLQDKGTEKVVGFCNAQNRWSGLNHDFGNIPFTQIEDFQAYLNLRKEHEKARQKKSRWALRPLVASASITFTVE